MTVCVGRPPPGCARLDSRGRLSPHEQRRSSLVIDDPLVAKLLEELADVGANLGGIGVGELSL
jgi:hypothetical protein